MKKLILVFDICALLTIGCKKETHITSSLNDLSSFHILSSTRVESSTTGLSCSVSDTLITGVTGNNDARTNLIASFTTTGNTVTVNGKLQESGITINDFTQPVVYTVIAQNGAQKCYTVKIKSFTGLPIFYINADAPIVSKDTYVTGNLEIDGNIDYTDGLYKGPIQIRGRGNSTWQMDKKPYKIKLPSKVSILGMPADKEWALIANYADKSLLRNDAAFELSEELGAAWTPRRKFVEVFLNGQYNGNYLLTETIEQGSDRVNVDTKNGGWLVEINHNAPTTDPRFYIASPSLNIVTDLKAGALDVSFVRPQLDSLYYMLNRQDYDSTTGYRKYFDMDAYVTWYIVNEVIINNDAAFYSSVFIQRYNASSKIKMGPVWDFDLSSGNVSTGHLSPEGWYIIYAVFADMLYEDPAFRAALKIKWNNNKSKILAISQYIDAKGKVLAPSANENFKRWDILNIWFPNTARVFGSYQGEVEYFKTWMDLRIQWMDKEINK